MKLKCTFKPQRWGGRKSDYACPADPMGEVDWAMDMAEIGLVWLVCGEDAARWADTINNQRTEA